MKTPATTSLPSVSRLGPIFLTSQHARVPSWAIVFGVGFRFASNFIACKALNDAFKEKSGSRLPWTVAITPQKQFKLKAVKSQIRSVVAVHVFCISQLM